jgi:shikimate kinase
MSGAGKSTLLGELARRGWRAVDTDYDGWTGPDGLWDEDRMASLLAGAERAAAGLVVSGTVANQGHFYDRFDHVVLLTVPLETLLERVVLRGNNPYGKKPAHRAEIARHVVEVEPLLRRGATLVLDGRRPVAELGDAVERGSSSGAGAGE